jgi:hypothetical protein
MKVNDQAFEILLEEYFFEYLDDGVSPENTPLIQHDRGLIDLIPMVAAHLGLPFEEAEDALTAAIAEVRL